MAPLNAPAEIVNQTASAPRKEPGRARNPIVRVLLIVVGWFSVAAGIAGIFLPLVPTVPLLLLAAACFVRSSDRFYRWLLDHRLLGPLVGRYLQGKGMPRRAKVVSVGMVWISIPVSAFLFVNQLWVRLLLFWVAIGITVYLVWLVPGDGKPEGPAQIH